MTSTADVKWSTCAHRLTEELETMRRFSLPGEGVTRLSFSEPYMQALAYLEARFRELGFTVDYDPVGNFIASNVAPGEACVAMGSHVDSVPNGGAYDGTAGVICALEVARLLPQTPLKIFSFIAEEGARFGSGLLGSRCVAGLVTPDELYKLNDADGLSFYEAAVAAGFRPDRVEECRASLEGVKAFLEIHIEQGRVLEELGESLGVVTDIVGIAHATVEIHGRADHAGATPMALRSDAGITAAEVLLELERVVIDVSNTAVGTVGLLQFSPGVHNVIPGQVLVGFDVRDRTEEAINTILERIRSYAVECATQRDQQVAYKENLRTAPVPLDKGITTTLTRAAESLGVPFTNIVSGGGHDAMMVARHVPTGMLFVPCRDGISHAPQEHAESEHLAGAVAVAIDTLTTLMPSTI